MRPADFDPAAAPLDPAFIDPQVRGAAVAGAELTAAALRERFRRPPPWLPEDLASGAARGVADGAAPEAQAPAMRNVPRAAAVLMALIERPDGIAVLFTERSPHLVDHAGQISFPGGRVEAADRDPVATALREADEELGLPPASVQVLGALPVHLTGTGFSVTPVVGLLGDAVELAALRPDSDEVAGVFEVPLRFLMDPANHQRRVIGAGTGRRTFYAMPYDAGGRSFFIWGATAAMLRNLYHLLRA